MFLGIENISFVLQATLFTWGITALGAAIVFFFKSVNAKFMSFIFGFGAGVMIAASFFSLILPGINLSKELGQIDFVVASLGFLCGGIFILLIDLFIARLDRKKENIEKKSMKNKLLLIIAITLHNIPEGMAIGVAFGAAALNLGGSSLQEAWLLAIGIGLQNFPEGIAVSLPLRTEGMSRRKSFFYGQLSGLVEPLSALIGASLVLLIRGILPFILCFAAGAMIYVVAEELIPSAKLNSKEKMGTLGVIFGFIVMMILDIALG